MEEAYNGKVEEETQQNQKTEKVEGNEENGELILKDANANKPETEPGREIPVEGNSESLNDSLDGNDLTPDEGIETATEAKVKDSDEQEIVPAIPEVSIQDSEDLDTNRVETREVEADDIDSTFNNVVVDGSDEIFSSVAASVDEATDAVEEKMVQQFSVDKMMPPLEENVLTITEVASEATEEVKAGVMENSSTESAMDVGNEGSEEKVDESEKPSADNRAVVESSDAYPETTEDSNTGSLSRSIRQPTTWRNCCGLFQVLRRSNT